MSYAPKPPLGHAPPPKKSPTTTIIVLVVVGVLGLLGLCCAGVAVALLLPAVNQAKQAAVMVETQNDLRALGLAYHQYRDANGKSPASWDELAGSGLLDSTTIQKLQTQNLVVEWNLDPNSVTTGLSEHVLAYPGGSPTELSSVLMGNGSVQVLPQDELQRRLSTQQSATVAGGSGHTAFP